MEPLAAAQFATPETEEANASILSGSPGFADAVERVRRALAPALDGLLRSSLVTSSIPEVQLARHFVETDLANARSDFEDYAELLREVIRHSVNMSSPRCLAHMTGAVPAFAVVLAEVVASLNQNLVRRDASRLISILERQVVAMLHRAAFGNGDTFYDAHAQAPGSSLGVFTSGGTLSNLGGLWIARHKAFPAEGEFHGVEADGLPAALAHHGWERAVILCSRLAHYSVRRSAAMLGIGEAGILALDAEGRQRLDVGALERALVDCAQKRWRVVAIVGVAGNTDSGAIDPLAEIADLAHQYATHFHVDAAWGGCWLFSRRLRTCLVGIERADTVALDLHKQFHLPVGTSLLLLRDPGGIAGLRQRASYILREDSRDLGEFSMEGSRNASSLLVHAALHLLGPGVLGEWTDATLDCAARMAELIEKSGDFELLLKPETNIVLYRYVPPGLRSRALNVQEEAWLNTLNVELHRAQLEGGRTLVSRTTIERPGAGSGSPIVALRAVIGNPRTTVDDLRAVLLDQSAIAAALVDRSEKSG